MYEGYVFVLLMNCRLSSSVVVSLDILVDVLEILVYFSITCFGEKYDVIDKF